VDEYRRYGGYCFVLNKGKAYQKSFEISGGTLQNRNCRDPMKVMKKGDKKYGSTGWFNR
jgi:hypothetical protein